MSEMLADAKALEEGFCLNYVELYNWGPFHKHVTHLEIDGENSLFLGLNGAGKSSACDAINTLLSSINDIVFNQSAEAKKNERSLASYVRGYWRNEVDENDGKKRVGLRDHGAVFTVILGNFICKAEKRTVTLVQVLKMQEDDAYPSRDFYVSEEKLTVRDDFLPFANDKRALHRHLNSLKTENFESYEKYSCHFKRLFGIKSAKSLKLFSKTIAMRTVDNITSFVKEFMLDKPDVEGQLHELIDHFDDLNKTYLAMCKARDQLQMLKPISAEGRIYTELTAKIVALDHARDALEYFIADKHLLSINEELNRVSREITANQSRSENCAQTIADYEEKLVKIDQDLKANGGDRLESLHSELRKADLLLAKVKNSALELEKILGNLQESLPKSADDFSALIDRLLALKEELIAREQEKDEALTSCEVQKLKLNQDLSEVSSELDSLLKRKSNITRRQLEIRSLICGGLNLNEEDLPFAGELLQVKDSERQLWEGAIEQVLHGFALSLLVPAEHYAEVTDFVWHHNLKGRLVYYKVEDRQRYERYDLDKRSLVGKLEIKPQSRFYAFLMDRLLKRFDYVCCEYEDEFLREVKALSPTGLVKDPGGRHEKDDRRDLKDKSSYVLGWSNDEKIRLLTARREETAARLKELLEQIRNYKNLRARDRERITVIAQIERVGFEDVDVSSAQQAVNELLAEKLALEESSEVFASLMKRRDKLSRELREGREKRDRLLEKAGSLKTLKDTLEAEKGQCELTLSTHVQAENADLAILEPLYIKRLPGKLTYQSFTGIYNAMKNELESRVRRLDESAHDSALKIVALMGKFKSRYEVDAKDLNADSVESLDAFLKLEKSIEDDKLPDFVETFERKLTDNTIIEVARFVQQLNEHCRSIQSNLNFINELLLPVDYNPGRYIKLVARDNKDIELREFQAKLKMCTSNASLSHDNLAEAEAKFKQISELIVRFKGGSAGQADENKRWRQKVIDVRNWYSYAAWECIRETDEVFDFNEDTGGKSGGQKEKLAYTILATSLAYQYGLSSDDDERRRSFRLVMLDEAFARSSPESATYCLKIFTRLKLQLLIITPMLKQDIIEPFVQHVLYFRARDNISQATHFLISDFTTCKELYRKLEKGELSAEERKLYDRLQKFGSSKERTKPQDERKQ